jgi:hypothetical protein
VKNVVQQHWEPSEPACWNAAAWNPPDVEDNRIEDVVEQDKSRQEEQGECKRGAGKSGGGHLVEKPVQRYIGRGKSLTLFL